MKNKTLSIELLVLMLFLTFFASDCAKQQNHDSVADKNSQSLQTLDEERISQLQNGVTVRVPAILVKADESNCIKLFTPDEFKKYDGDWKWAVSSRLASDSDLSDSFAQRKEVIVTGKMIFVKDVADTSKSCGIVTGQIFEISDIEYF